MHKRMGLICGLIVGLASSGALAAPITLRVAILDDIATAPTFGQLIDQFETAHPDIHVELLQQYREDFSKLAVQAAGGAAPDIFAGYGNLPAQALNQGLLLNLTPYIQRDKLQPLVDDFVPSTLAMMTSEGRIYAFPKYSATGATYYNSEMLANAGLQPPATDWSWDDFALYAKKLTITDNNRTTQFGYNLNNSWIWTYPWFVAAGVDFSDPYKVELDSPAGIAAATFLLDMQKQGSLQWRFGRFPEREAAMTTSGSWELKAWITKDLPLGVAAMPTGPARKAAQTNNDIIGISRASKHPDAAWTFLSWLYSRPIQEAYLKLFGLQPARVSLGRQWQDDIVSQLHAQGSDVPEGIDTFLDATAYAAQEPLFADPQVISDHVMLALNKIIRARMPVASTLKAESEAAEAYLASKK